MIDFPGPPLTVGQIFTAAGCSWKWNGTNWVANTAGGGGSTLTIGDTPPTSPVSGSGWWDSTEGNLYLWYDDPSADTGQWVPAVNLPGPVGPSGTVGATGATGAIGPPGVKSFIHNGLFNILQRGVGPWANANVFTADRWQVSYGGGTISALVGSAADVHRTQVGDEAMQGYLQATIAGGSGVNDLTTFVQSIEGVRRLAGKTVTISFWAIAGSGTPKVGIGLFQQFGSGGSPSSQVIINSAAVTLNATAFTRYSVTLSLPSVAGKTLGTNNNDCTQLAFWMSAGANFNTNAGGIGVQSNTFSFWGVQLEIGSTATTLEKPDPADDLARCQRFYTVLTQALPTGYNGAGNFCYYTFELPVQMRVSPTLAFSTPAYLNASSFALNASSPSVLRVSFQIAATGYGYCAVDLLLSADL